MAVNGQAWAVVIHDDDVNTHYSAMYAVNQAYGLPMDRCLEVARDVDTNGRTDLTWCAEREQAEQLVAHLQVLGLRASVRGA